MVKLYETSAQFENKIVFQKNIYFTLKVFQLVRQRNTFH